MLGVNIGWNVYQDCSGILQRNPQIRPADGFEKIDAAWLASHAVRPQNRKTIDIKCLIGFIVFTVKL